MSNLPTCKHRSSSRYTRLTTRAQHPHTRKHNLPGGDIFLQRSVRAPAGMIVLSHHEQNSPRLRLTSLTCPFSPLSTVLNNAVYSPAFSNPQDRIFTFKVCIASIACVCFSSRFIVGRVNGWPVRLLPPPALLLGLQILYWQVKISKTRGVRRACRRLFTRERVCSGLGWRMGCWACRACLV